MTVDALRTVLPTRLAQFFTLPGFHVGPVARLSFSCQLLLPLFLCCGFHPLGLPRKQCRAQLLGLVLDAASWLHGHPYSPLFVLYVCRAIWSSRGIMSAQRHVLRDVCNIPCSSVYWANQSQSSLPLVDCRRPAVSVWKDCACSRRCASLSRCRAIVKCPTTRLFVCLA